MLILNGSAEYMLTTDQYTQGDRHSFNMFVKNDDLNAQLDNIEKYLVGKGWDNIEITDNGLIENIEEISHSVLIEAFKKAQVEGICAVVNNTAIKD
ncbi:hypothetical protein [Colwellia sp. E2M01]|uniref:hypothetical protein n=1 Tax=Colwellia sp. E2M01 TaxID=2841561 RepID=UPI001C082E9A|nr:hypothetical protein [Colwellia sp. E2M01]MBU2869959.1 hypothetical protein [Colwellia sp. E2M01]